MDDFDLAILGACAVIETFEGCDVSHWPESARSLLRHAAELAKLARQENRSLHHMARLAAEQQCMADGRLACMSYQGVN